MLSFSGETGVTAVRAFDRYGLVRIVVADPQLAEQKITGLFKANGLKGFATAVVSSFGAAVASDGDVLRIVTKNSPNTCPERRALPHPSLEAGCLSRC
jgi:transmembrane sensor